MNVAVHIGLGMVDYFMGVLVKAVIGLKRIRVEFRSRCYILPNLPMKVMLAARTYNRRVNFIRLSVEEPEYNRLTFWSTTVNLLGALVRVHIPRFAAYESLISFYCAGHLVDGSVVLGVPNAVQHEPCSLLGYLKCACDLVRTNSVLTVCQQPHCSKPLIETDGRILEDSSDFDAELLPAFETRPHQASLEKRQAFAGASGALRSLGPLGFRNSFQANHGVRKVPDGLHQAV